LRLLVLATQRANSSTGSSARFLRGEAYVTGVIVHVAEGWCSSTSEQEDSIGFGAEKSQIKNPSFVEHHLQAHLAFSYQYQGGINTVLWMDTP